MNTFIRAMAVLVATFSVGAAAEESKCQSSLSIKDAVVAMGEGVAAQPVFKGGGLVGYRLYNTRRSDQLTKQAINPGDMMTHVCGVAASDIHAKGGDICCNCDATRAFEVTFKVNGEERKIVIQRP